MTGPSPAEPRRLAASRLTLWLLLLAAIVRVAAFCEPPAIGLEEVRYLVAAQHLREGLGYSDWRGPEVDIAPLHPWLTALLGGARSTLERRGRLVGLLASIALLAPVFLIARRLGGERAGLLVLALLAAHPWLVRAAPMAQAEGLYVLAAAAAILAVWPRPAAPSSANPVALSDGAGRQAGCDRVRRWGLGGLLFGVSYLARPEGIIVGVVALGPALTPCRGRRIILKAGAFALGLLCAALPYLIFLRLQTGGWALTGKSSEIFFIGQAMHQAGETPPEAASYLALQKEWKSVAPYVVAHPVATLRGMARNLLRILTSILPRALGPAGLLGLVSCGLFPWPDRSRRRSLLLVATPALSLGLMLMSVPEDRVAGSTLPFLMILAAVGLDRLATRLRLDSPGRRLPAIALLALMIGLGWSGAAARAWAGVGGSTRPLLTRAAIEARHAAGEGGAVASNDPALSFYLSDPLLFGPSGRYRALSSELSCSGLVRGMRERGAARVALLEAPAGAPIGAEEPGCPLRPAGSVAVPQEGQIIWIVTLEPGGESPTR